MKKLLIFFVAAIFSSSVFAYPITPRPLRKLVIESQYIIQGKVLKLDRVNVKGKKNDYWETDIAIIMVREVLQGKITSDTITVYYTAGLICPAPAVYIKNDEIITFLDKSEKIKDGYTTHALSYGVKFSLSKEGVDIYKARIREMQEILTISNTAEKEEKTIDWLVRCAENKVTRWEGVYELSPESDFMSYYDRDRLVRKDIYLTSVQRENLFEILLKSEQLDYDDLALVDITTGIDDSKLLALLKTNLPKVDTKYLWSAEEIMRRIVKLTGNIELEGLWKQFAEFSIYDEKEKEAKKKVHAEFIKKMENVGLKTVLAASGFSNS